MYQSNTWSTHPTYRVGAREVGVRGRDRAAWAGIGNGPRRGGWQSLPCRPRTARPGGVFGSAQAYPAVLDRARRSAAMSPGDCCRTPSRSPPPGGPVRESGAMHPRLAEMRAGGRNHDDGASCTGRPSSSRWRRRSLQSRSPPYSTACPGRFGFCLITVDIKHCREPSNTSRSRSRSASRPPASICARLASCANWSADARALRRQPPGVAGSVATRPIALRKGPDGPSRHLLACSRRTEIHTPQRGAERLARTPLERLRTPVSEALPRSSSPRRWMHWVGGRAILGWRIRGPLATSGSARGPLTRSLAAGDVRAIRARSSGSQAPRMQTSSSRFRVWRPAGQLPRAMCRRHEQSGASDPGKAHSHLQSRAPTKGATEGGRLQCRRDTPRPSRLHATRRRPARNRSSLLADWNCGIDGPGA